MENSSMYPAASGIEWEPKTFSNENGAYIDYSPESYDALLEEKVERLRTQFRSIGYLPDGVTVEVSPSVREHYRSRCKFGITKKNGQRCYVMWEHGMAEKDRVYFLQFPLATKEVNHLMLRLLKEIDGIPIISQNLVRVNFLCATTGDSIITLLYEEPLLVGWREAAQALSVKLGCSIMARSRQVDQVPNPRFWSPTCTVGRNYVVERYRLADGRDLQYKQPEGSFSNPNASVCIGTLNWLCDVSSQIENAKEHDFLELYCGNGNHTVALSPYFRMVVGIELDSALVEAANDNLEANGLQNAHVVCRASGQYCSEVLKRRKRGYSRAREQRQRNAFSVSKGEATPTTSNEGRTGHEDKHSCTNHHAGNEDVPQKNNNHYLLAAGCSISAASDEKLVLEPTQPSMAGAGTCSVMAEEGLRCNFRTVLVDPPRSGLDSVTLKFLKGHQNVLYISCNPDALQRDLTGLLKTHELTRFIVFDHFPYTKHAECGVYLQRRPPRHANIRMQSNF